MDTRSVDEPTPPIVDEGIPIPIGDTRRPYEKQLAVHLILATILLEAAAYFTLDTNLVYGLSYNEALNWTFPHSSTAANIFEGTGLISMLIFAVISDAKLGRARTIIIGLPLYLTGSTLFTVIAKGTTSICNLHQPDHGNRTSIGNEPCAPQILAILIITAIGAGAVRANMIAFGADQIPDSIVTSRYFDKFVVAINIASILQTLPVVYIPDGPNLIFALLIIGTSMLFLAVLLFIIGWRYYIHVKPYDSVVTNCIPVNKNAFQTWRQYKKNKRRIQRGDTNVSSSNFFDPSNSLNEVVEESLRIDERPSAFLDFAKLVNNGKFLDRIVDDVKSLQNAIIIFILVFPYRLVFTQLYTTFVSQAAHMKHQANMETVNMVLLSEPVTVIVGVVILNMFVYKYLHARNRSLSIATKFVISMCFGFLTMCIAGGVEILRQEHCPESKEVSNIRSNLTIYAQLPQDIGMGLAQLFGLLANFEFAYFVAPRSAQSLFMSLHYLSRGIASYIYDAYIHILQKNAIDLKFTCPTEGKYEWHYFTYFFILAGFQLIFIIIFIVCHKTIRMIKLNRQKMERNQFLLQVSSRSVN